jgi:hypothetical protein
MAAVEPSLAPQINYTGEYILDKGNSDSMQPFLKEVGAPWFVRKVLTSYAAILLLTEVL